MITFETKCYENDWEFLLKGGYLSEMISRCNCIFEKKVVNINNVENPMNVGMHAQRLVEAGVIDEYVFVDDHAEEALNFFGINKASFNGGYYYSISELVGIYRCQTPYLLHFSSDSILEFQNCTWISDAVKLMDRREDYVVANPLWHSMIENAIQESIDQNEDWIIGQGFSDQCYLIKTKVFKSKIYSENNVASERYPAYGGELFEKRIDSYMRNHKLLRLTHKHAVYVSKNFPKAIVKRLIRKIRIRLLLVRSRFLRRLKI